MYSARRLRLETAIAAIVLLAAMGLRVAPELVRPSHEVLHEAHEYTVTSCGGDERRSPLPVIVATTCVELSDRDIDPASEAPAPIVDGHCVSAVRRETLPREDP